MQFRTWLPWSTAPLLGHWLRTVLGVLAVGSALFLLLALRLEWISVLPSGSPVEPATEEPGSAAQQATTVELPLEKLAAANLHLAVAEVRDIQPTHAVPAAITYDAARRVPVNAPVAGVVLKVLVEPGQQISTNQPLAVFSSPEVGLARDEALRRQADLELARKQQAFSDEIASNVARLLELLEQRPKPDELEKAFAGRPLGEYREKIMAAHSKLVLAEMRQRSSSGLEDALSRLTIVERKSDREVAAAQFAAACESARFAASQDRDKAAAGVEQAERLLAVARQSLKNVLGPLSDMSVVTDQEKLSEFVLLSPLGGRIEERQAVESARVAAGGHLFLIADTSVMWISAEIHERHWPALELTQGGSISVRVPALGDGELPAKVRFVGAEVGAETRSVPLVAEIDNAGGKLRPGMFAWALVPLSRPGKSLAVPPSAILRHEGQAFVFVPAGASGFRRVDVETGLESASGIEILRGLEPGTQVVDRGAFFLKSELLLEREE
jgi:cobalt-zinc-cadmium efflux system membrane fusion protein